MFYTSDIFLGVLIFFLKLQTKWAIIDQWVDRYICVTFVIESQANATAIMEMRKKTERADQSAPLSEDISSSENYKNTFDPQTSEDVTAINADDDDLDKQNTVSDNGMYYYFQDEGGKSIFKTIFFQFHFLKIVVWGKLKSCLPYQSSGIGNYVGGLSWK